MKLKTIFAVAAAAFLAAACASQAEPASTEGNEENQEIPAAQKSIKELTPSKATVDSVSYLLGINFGSFLKSYGFGGDLNYAAMKKGMLDFVNSKGSPRSADFGEQFKINPEKMDELFNTFLQNKKEVESRINAEKNEKYLAANKNKEGVNTTASGLQYKIIEPGDESVKAGPADTVLVNYKGTLIDGSVFDESPAGEPVKLMLNRVIPGWTEGLQLVGKGGKIQLTIPSELGYGARGTQGIAPNSLLLFDVEICDVLPVAPAAE